MSRGKRTRISTGIYRDPSGYSIIWRAGGASVEKRFTLDTPLYVLKDYRRHQLEKAGRHAAVNERVGIARDVVTFLRNRKHLPCYKSDRAHLRPWVHRFAGRSRWAITSEDCAKAIGEWRQTYSAREIRHRAQILGLLFRTLDGPKARTPIDDVPLPKIPQPRAISVADATVRAVAVELKRHEEIGRLRDSKTRARYLVLATTGQRPTQMMRATSDTVDLERRIWFVTPAKGDRGTIVYLNDDMLASWQLFAAADAWGPYNARSFSKTLKRCGWPQQVRPYNLRHTVGLSLSALDVDLGDIQAHMGHSSTDTTRAYYVPKLLARLKALSEKLDGRLAGCAVPSSRATITPSTQTESVGNGRKRTQSRQARATEQDQKKTA